MTGRNHLALNDKAASFSALSPAVKCNANATHHFVHKRHIWDIWCYCSARSRPFKVGESVFQMNVYVDILDGSRIYLYMPYEIQHENYLCRKRLTQALKQRSGSNQLKSNGEKKRLRASHRFRVRECITKHGEAIPKHSNRLMRINFTVYL